ncbi:MAG: N-formylglutamate amidohydrolase [Sneathiellales bacterium]|nr:N-formylglutamate amidohydrolase [Sneathiellales bacterium]
MTSCFTSHSPVDVTFPKIWNRPIIFSSPHSGRIYPDEFIGLSDLTLTNLRQSEDFHVDYLISDVVALGAPLIKATFPRAYCDPNRKPYELDPSMFSDPLPDYASTQSPRLCSGIGTIPKVVSAGQVIHKKKLPLKEALLRIETCYFPFHQQLECLINECLKKFGVAFLVDCHSMPNPPEINHADFVLGDRYGQSCPGDFTVNISNYIQHRGYRTAFNAPYAGGYITQKYSNPAKRVYTLQLEISRPLYMEASSLTLTDNAKHLKADLNQIFEQLLNGIKIPKAPPSILAAE